MGFNVIDQVIVGLLGADAVAAVGLSNSIASIALLLYASAGVGAGVMVARALGRKDLKEVSQIASTGQGLSGLLGLITVFLLISFSQPLLRLVGADPKLVGSANAYFQLYAVSIAPMILSAVTSAVFRSLNAPRTPLIITSAAVALNTVLGFVLVLGFGPIPSFGVTGAGWATLLSQSGRCLALILFLYGSKNGVRWVWPLPGSKVGTTAGKLLRLTGPIAISEVLWGMSTFIYAVVFTRLGTTKLAASQIGGAVDSQWQDLGAGGSGARGERLYADAVEESVPGQLKPGELEGKPLSPEEMFEKIRQLQKENEYLKRRREILKKAMSIVREEPNPGLR
jgi:putative MATE family efflux protein